MFNIGPQELLLILVLALLVVGPKRLPEIARTVGKGVRELRRAQDEVRKTIQVNLDEPSPSRARSRTPRRLPVEATEASPEPATAEDGGDETPAASGSDLAAPAAAAAAAEPSGVSEISRSLGRTLADLRRAREEVQRSFRVDLDQPAPSRPSPPAANGDRPSASSPDPEPDPEVTSASADPVGGSNAAAERRDADPERPS